jgi:3D (Asp-Asp-Asp) domain-containing protein
MLSSHVRDNRILLAVVCSAVLTLGLMVSARLLASPQDAPLLMSVLGTAPNKQSVWRPASEVAASAVERTDEAARAGITREGNAKPIAAVTEEDVRWFNGRPVRRAATMTMLVTAYSPDARSCGKHADGITASGYSVWTNGMKLVAADTKVLPFGSLVSIPGYGGEEGEIVPVLDRGGKIKGKRLDVLYSTHEIARRWGAQRLEVTVWEYADGEPSGFRTQH